MFQSALVTSSTYFLAYGKSALIAMAGQSKQAKKVYRPSLKDSLPAEEVLWINSCDSYKRMMRATGKSERRDCGNKVPPGTR